jgi:hypothetical protein
MAKRKDKYEKDFLDKYEEVIESLIEGAQERIEEAAEDGEKYKSKELAVSLIDLTHENETFLDFINYPLNDRRSIINRVLNAVGFDKIDDRELNRLFVAHYVGFDANPPLPPLPKAPYQKTRPPMPSSKAPRLPPTIRGMPRHFGNLSKDLQNKIAMSNQLSYKDVVNLKLSGKAVQINDRVLEAKKLTSPLYVYLQNKYRASFPLIKQYLAENGLSRNNGRDRDRYPPAGMFSREYNQDIGDMIKYLA